MCSVCVNGCKLIRFVRLIGSYLIILRLFISDTCYSLFYSLSFKSKAVVHLLYGANKNLFLWDIFDSPVFLFIVIFKHNQKRFVIISLFETLKIL